VDTRYGLLAVAGTPVPIVQRLNATIAKALATNEIRQSYAALSLDPVSSTPQEYAAYLRTEIARWRKVVAAAKLPPQ
jgi:tripartite-type tricarboxylate transporter receptor subunit TctC